MTIKKGQEWGEAVTRPSDLSVAASDAELAAWNAVDGPVGVSGGDIYRSVGAPEPRRDAVRLPIDRMHVVFDEQAAVAVAHVVARRDVGRFGRWVPWWSWWRGDLLGVCNADFVGAWNVAPRAHPNDGRFDVVDVKDMGLRERWAASRRLAYGTHVPHPAISVRTATEASWQFARPMRIWVDDVDCGTCSELSVSIEPDALAIIV